MAKPSPSPAFSLWKGAKPLSVMILDDERFDRHRMARLCSGLGRPCEITNALTLDGFDALLDEQIFDLILVDYMLADGTGLQALETMRCSRRNFNTAAIMITGNEDPRMQAAAMRAGCTDVLLKTGLTPEHFAQAVEKALTTETELVPTGSDHFTRADLEAALSAMSRHNVKELKPLVSRTLRLVRNNRGTGASADDTALEQSCLDLWESLIQLERASGADLVAQALSTREKQTTIDARKPPSPFSRMRH